MIQPGNITPSTRDLMQFVSPNSDEQDTLMQCALRVPEDIAKVQPEFTQWEDKEIAALILDMRACPSATQTVFLAQAKQQLTCPILQLKKVFTEADLESARQMGFDGVITPVSHLTADNFNALYTHEQSMHGRLVPLVTQNTDWEILALAKPKFIYLDATFSGKIPPSVQQSKLWFMGSANLSRNYPLKCLVQEVS